MNIFIILAIAMTIILFLLRKHYPIGPSILIGGLVMWLLQAPTLIHLWQAATSTLSLQRTYDLLLALYFVMCLEIQLRTSGTLAGMVKGLQVVFDNPKLRLTIMPAFLGLLPSLGGARFSAPIVEETSKGMGLTPENKSIINFYFRHIFEYSNPINPGMILAASIAMIPLNALILHLGWLTALAFFIGWIIYVRPLQVAPQPPTILSKEEKETSILDIFLCLTPVFINVILVIFFNLSASLSMLIVVISMFAILRCSRRTVNMQEVFLGALDSKMLLNIGCILYFIQLLTVTGILDTLVATLNSAPLPPVVIIAILSLLIGILTGLSQGHVSIMLPIVATMAPGDLTMIGIAMAFGIAGQMITPTHLCYTITLDYFHADFFKTLPPLLIIEGSILVIFSLITYVMK